MNEGLDSTAILGEISAIITDIEGIAKVVKDVDELIEAAIKSGASLGGSGATSLKKSWNSALEASKNYEASLNEWVAAVKTQEALFHSMEGDISGDMESVAAGAIVDSVFGQIFNIASTFLASHDVDNVNDFSEEQYSEYQKDMAELLNKNGFK